MSESERVTGPNIFPFLRYKDAAAAIAWLGKAFGFEEHLVVPNTDGTIAHGELRLGTGIVMLGTAKDDFLGMKTPADLGAVNQGIYVVLDDPDEHHARAVAAGAEIVQELTDEDYGSRGYAARDPEGNLWSFGTYRPGVAPRPDEWESVLKSMEVTHLRGVRVAAEVPATHSALIGQGNVVVSLPIASRAAAEASLGGAGSGAAVAWVAELDPEADALAVYKSGQKAPFVMRQNDGPVTRLAGTFVAFLPGQDADVAKLQEDGFVVALTGPSWQALSAAVAQGRDLELLGAPQSMAIRIRWRD
jgi:uncharacterized glyoxalase superfamily protein PhnB